MPEGVGDGDDGMGGDPAGKAQDQHIEVLAGQLRLRAGDVATRRVVADRIGPDELQPLRLEQPPRLRALAHDDLARGVDLPEADEGGSDIVHV